MKIFDVLQISDIDQYTILHEPISSLDLMERAASAFSAAFSKTITPDVPLHIFAGPGNNGGDALAVGRQLSESGYRISVYLINPKGKLSPDCEKNRERLPHTPRLVFREFRDCVPDPVINETDVIIDGLFGSGLNKPVEGIFADCIDLMNAAQTPVYSIDLPSGLFAGDNTHNSGPVVQASKTYTFQSPKLAFLFPDSGVFAGDWEVLDIGLSRERIDQLSTPYYYTEAKDLKPLLRQRGKFAYKNQLGQALLIVGGKGKIGAAVLSALACMRSGVGLLTAHVPSAGECVLHTAVPELMLSLDPDPHSISTVPGLSVYSSLGIGPGIGTDERTVKAMEELLSRYDKPMVLDADALNILSKHPELINQVPANSILTPHVGELERLVGRETSGYKRLQKARDLAQRKQLILVVKGAYSAICLPDGSVRFNSTGNPGMATAGSGDVLTGIITGLLAQGYAPSDAATLGVYRHGKAGDDALRFRSVDSLIARDIIDQL